jgi:hypothetical protein
LEGAATRSGFFLRSEAELKKAVSMAGGRHLHFNLALSNLALSLSRARSRLLRK